MPPNPLLTSPTMYGLCILGLLCLQIVPSIALVPLECVHNVTHPAQVCCPLNHHNGLTCGGPKRGFCELIHSAKEEVPDIFWKDDRMMWPTRFIKHACQCKEHYYGLACEQCWFGWTGPDCSIREKRTRRDIRNLSPIELKVFKDVVARSWTWPSGYAVLEEIDNANSDPVKDPHFIPASIQYYITYLHAYGSRSTLFTDENKCDEFGILDFNHDGVTFPTWHRYFHLIWERLLGEIAYKVHKVKTFSLPYWDWIGMKECDICINRYIGAPGRANKQGQGIDQGSPFYNKTEFCWEPEPGMTCAGCQKFGHRGVMTRRLISNDFPEQADAEFVLNLKDYFYPGERDVARCKSFHMALEGFCGRPGADPSLLWMHNKVHNMIQGSMQSTTTATNDPFFILHHSFVDKMFSMWYRRHKPKLSAYPNKHVRPGHKRDAFMIGIIPLSRNVDMLTDVTDLGYDYEYADSVGNFAQNGKPPLFN